MTAKTVSKTDSKYNVKLIAITAMCAALITVTTALHYILNRVFETVLAVIVISSQKHF